MKFKKENFLLWLIGITLLFPIFFQLSGRIYNSNVPIYDSGGVLTALPLPISIITCFGGIIILISNYRRAFLALTVVVAMLVVMLASLIFAAIDMDIERRKVILMLQFLLPVFGLVLGQLIVDKDQIIARAFLCVLMTIVPLQLLAGFMVGSLTLTHNLYLFGIYQHFQYVPLIFVCAYGYSMVELWDSRRKLLLTLTPLMFLYSVASVSFLTIIAFMLFLTVFTYTKLRINHNRLLTIVVSAIGLLALVVFMQAYFSIEKNNTSIGLMESSLGIRSGQYAAKFNALEQGKTPANVNERFEIWKLYGSHISESTGTLLLGHEAPLPREVKSSAHNWYLDITYNFGLFSILPVFGLICFTIFMFWKYRESLPRETLWLAGIVFYLVIIDGNLKVPLRQPYSGIFAFFLWGLLLTKLHNNHTDKASS